MFNWQAAEATGSSSEARWWDVVIVSRGIRSMGNLGHAPHRVMGSRVEVGVGDGWFDNESGSAGPTGERGHILVLFHTNIEDLGSDALTRAHPRHGRGVAWNVIGMMPNTL